jgi:hypothetical protein
VPAAAGEAAAVSGAAYLVIDQLLAPDTIERTLA